MSKQKTDKKVILAVGYARKSTREERSEKSIADQKARISELKPPDEGARYEIVRWYEKDLGVPGWKEGAKRPDFFRLVNELPETQAVAILVDDMDRFARRELPEVVHDVQELRQKNGIRYLHSCCQGCRDLEGGPVVWMQIAMEAMASREHCTRLSRRVAHARLDAAQLGKRSGGRAPYGLENDGKGGLRHGDPAKVRTVRWIFDQFVNHYKSMRWIAGELNRKGVKGPQGKIWQVPAVRQILMRREYAGDFSYNLKKAGIFHIVNGDKKVVPVSQYLDKGRKLWRPTEEGRIVKQNVFKPVVSRKLFDLAQRRLAELAEKNSRRPRSNGYPLSGGILICGHCGKPMVGNHQTDRPNRAYVCCSRTRYGKSACGAYRVLEPRILPLVMKLLGEEITDIKKLLSAPPEELLEPRKLEREQREAKQLGCEDLAEKIDLACKNLMWCKDAESHKYIEREIARMREELEGLKKELAGVKPAAAGRNSDDLEALTEWWEDFTARAISVPIPPGKLTPKEDLLAMFWRDPFAEAETDERVVYVDARVVNETLHQLGCRVTLWWETKTVTLSSGGTQDRHALVKGRIQFGQKKAVTMRLARSGGR